MALDSETIEEIKSIEWIVLSSILATYALKITL